MVVERFAWRRMFWMTMSETPSAYRFVVTDVATLQLKEIFTMTRVLEALTGHEEYLGATPD
jgi:hypothetical protein